MKRSLVVFQIDGDMGLTEPFEFLTPTEAGSGIIGLPTDMQWSDGPAPIRETDTVANAVDKLNEIIGLIHPGPTSLQGAMPVTQPTMYTGGLSGGAGQIFTSYVPGQTVSTIISGGPQISAVTPSSPANQFGFADQGELELWVNGSKIDSVPLASLFNEAERQGAQTTTPWVGGAGLLTVSSVQMYNSIPAYQRGQFSVVLPTSLFSQGQNDFTIQIKHSIDATTSYDTSTFTASYFYDTSATRPAIIGTPTVSESALVSSKYLSGVRFYSLGDSFAFSLGATGIFDNTYHATPIQVSMQGLSTKQLPVGDASISGPSSPPVIGDSFVVTGKTYTLDAAGVASSDARASITPRDPIGSGSLAQSASANRLVNTYASMSTDLTDSFQDEVYRLPAGAYSTPPSRTGQWNSATALTNGSAQVFSGTLRFPNTNYGTYLPSQSANYAGFSGSQVYLRSMYKTVPKNSGTLRITGITSADLGTNVKVEIKLPSQTGWLDLGVGFSAATFTGADGDGCLVGSSGSDFQWTSGVFSTANAGFMCIVRITLLNSSKAITYLAEIAW